MSSPIFSKDKIKFCEKIVGKKKIRDKLKKGTIPGQGSPIPP